MQRLLYSIIIRKTLKSSGKFSLVDLSLLGAVLIWALNFTVIKNSLAEVGPHTFNAVRFVLATAFIWYIIWRRGDWFSIKKSHIIPLIGLALLGHTIYQWLFIIGIDFTYAANAAIMLGTLPIWIAITSHLLSVEKLTPFRIGGVLLGFVGIVIIMTGGTEPVSLGSDSFLGDLLIISGAILFGVYTIYSRKFLSTYTPLQFSGLTIGIGTIALTLYAMPELARTDWPEVSLSAWGGMFYSGCLGIALANLIWNNGLLHVGTVRTATYQNLVPAFGLLFGVVLLNESLGPWQYVGAALTVAGIALARR